MQKYKNDLQKEKQPHQRTGILERKKKMKRRRRRKRQIPSTQMERFSSGDPKAQINPPRTTKQLHQD